MLRLTVFLHWSLLGNGVCLGEDGGKDGHGLWPPGVCGPVGETGSYTSNASCRDRGAGGAWTGGPSLVWGYGVLRSECEGSRCNRKGGGSQGLKGGRLA